MISAPKNLPATDAVVTSVEDSCYESSAPPARVRKNKFRSMRARVEGSAARASHKLHVYRHEITVATKNLLFPATDNRQLAASHLRRALWPYCDLPSRAG